jgi:hypothetical protein
MRGKCDHGRPPVPGAASALSSWGVALSLFRRPPVRHPDAATISKPYAQARISNFARIGQEVSERFYNHRPLLAQETAALRDSNLAYLGSGSKPASLRVSFRQLRTCLPNWLGQITIVCTPSVRATLPLARAPAQQPGKPAATFPSRLRRQRCSRATAIAANATVQDRARTSAFASCGHSTAQAIGSNVPLMHRNKIS